MPARTTLRAAAFALIMTGAAGCAGGPAPDVADTAAARIGREGPAVERLTSAATALTVDTIARGLAVPWGIALLPDGRMLVTERAGRIRVLDDSGLRAEPWATLPVYADDPRVLPEAGLMGIAVAPDFATTRHVYVMGTFRSAAADTATTAGARVRRMLGRLSRGRAFSTGLENRVYRLTDRDGRGGAPVRIGPPLATDYYHAGGALAFGPDARLHASLGDAMRPDLAGRELLAAVVRFDAPTGGTAVSGANGAAVSGAATPFARGLRNVQALAWHPRTRELFAIDHGPTGMPQEGGRSGDDELNVLREGAWYGWGARPSSRDSARAVSPVALWPRAIAPAGLAFAPRSWGEDVLLVTGLRSGALHRLELARTADGAWRVVGEERLLEGHGRLRALATDPDGAVYVGTSNADGRGVKRPDGDLLLRVRPPALTVGAGAARDAAQYSAAPRARE